MQMLHFQILRSRLLHMRHIYQVLTNCEDQQCHAYCQQQNDTCIVFRIQEYVSIYPSTFHLSQLSITDTIELVNHSYLGTCMM